MKTTATMFFALITIFFLSAGANAQIKEGGRFETEMEKLSEELDDFDFKDSHNHSDWDWNGDSFKEAMADLRVEMDDLKEELADMDIDIDLDFDDASDGIHINVDIDEDFFDNILEEVEDGLEEAAEDIAETTEEIREFKIRLSEELETDGYIGDANDTYKFEYEEDHIAVDGTAIKDEHYRKYRRLVRDHFHNGCHGTTEFIYNHK